MKCSAFIATSVDGYIATEDGDVSWLETSGKVNVDLGDQADMGFGDFMAAVDCIVMGRKSMAKLSSFALSPEEWPYKGRPIYVLSRTLRQPTSGLHGEVCMYRGTVTKLAETLEAKGFTHAYIDGGEVITAFLNARLIDAMTITQAPILLGAGRPLFGTLCNTAQLRLVQSTSYANDFVQSHYEVVYPKEGVSLE